MIGGLLEFNGVTTWDLGITVGDREIGLAPPRIVTASVPFRNGQYDFSRMDGDLHYDVRKLKYVFNVIGKTPEKAADKLSEVLEWIYSDGTGYMYDNGVCMRFTGVSVSGEPSIEYVGAAKRAIRLTANFTANPTAYVCKRIIAATGTGAAQYVLVTNSNGLRRIYNMADAYEKSVTSMASYSLTDDGLSFSFDSAPCVYHAPAYKANEGKTYFYIIPPTSVGSTMCCSGATMSDGVWYYTPSGFTYSEESSGIDEDQFIESPLTVCKKYTSIPAADGSYFGLKVRILSGSGTYSINQSAGSYPAGVIDITGETANWEIYTYDIGGAV